MKLNFSADEVPEKVVLDVARWTSNRATIKHFINSDVVNYRKHVARNPNLNAKQQKVLSTDPMEVVRASLSINVSLCREMFETLIHDNNKKVRCMLFRNPSVPADFVDKYFKIENEAMCHCAASNVGFPANFLHEIAKNNDEEEAKLLAKNDSIYTETVLYLKAVFPDLEFSDKNEGKYLKANKK